MQTNLNGSLLGRKKKKKKKKLKKGKSAANEDQMLAGDLMEAQQILEKQMSQIEEVPTEQEV